MTVLELVDAVGAVVPMNYGQIDTICTSDGEVTTRGVQAVRKNIGFIDEVVVVIAHDLGYWSWNTMEMTLCSMSDSDHLLVSTGSRSKHEVV
jgi:hypothetical protein